MKKLSFLIISFSFFIQGCATVQPWERGTLARSEMLFVPDPLEKSIQTHTYFAKEAAELVTSGAGGGCGCN